MRADWSGRALFALFLLALAGFAWVSRHPESPIVERAQEWPLVGPLATSFRAARLPAATAPVPDSSTPILVEVVEPRVVDARPMLWLPAGTPVRSTPEPDGIVVATVEHRANLRWLERRGDWYRVERLSREPAGELAGWARVVDPAVSFPTLPGTVEPPAPMPAVPIDGELLASARRLMGPVRSPRRCGPYELWTDAPPVWLEALCAEVVEPLERAYARRYRLEPVGEPAETILLFAREQAFAAFEATTARPHPFSRGQASPARGYAALYLEGRSREAVSTTLVHELAHLLNRRAIGPALPAWLDEGMAEDLADARVGGKYRDPAGRFDGRTPAGETLPIAELLELGQGRFRQRSARAYAEAVLLVRFLMEDPRLRPGFRRYLEYLSAGGANREGALTEHLGVGAEELQREWEGWIAREAPGGRSGEARPG